MIDSALRAIGTGRRGPTLSREVRRIVGQPVEKSTPDVTSRMECLHRAPDDDFFCLRYEVWYPSRDCAIRTKFRTCPGCADCDQGRFNLRRHAVDLATVGIPGAAAGR